MRKINVQKIKQTYFNENPETNGPKYAIAVLLEECTRVGDEIPFRRIKKTAGFIKEGFPEYVKEVDDFVKKIKKNKGVI